MQRKTISYFYESIGFTVFAVLAAGCIGLFSGGGIAALLQVVFITLVLGVMEVSLSFDNAVVNASILKHWDAKWRARFVNWGMPIAVFGMRLVFPLAIVSAIAWINPIDVVQMALFRPDEYSRHLTAIHVQVSAFGGAFLMMVGLQYFVEEKQTYWWEALESRLAKLGDLNMVEAGIVVLLTLIISAFIPHHEQLSFVISSMAGLTVFIFAKGAGDLLSGGGEHDADGNKIVKAGVAGFLYLELLDASFSFDGVIGAFALSNSLVIIALGLGIGAFFVRSLTLLLVDKGTLSEYRYLEHGAFYAIIVLATIMYLSVFVEIPEIVTGGLGAGLIGLAFWHSVRANKAEQVTST